MRRVFGERPEVAAEGLAYKDTDDDVDDSLGTPQVRVCAGLASIAVVSLLGIVYAVSSSSTGNHNQSSIADEKNVLDMLYTEVRKNSEVLKTQLHEAQDEKQVWKKRALHDLEKEELYGDTVEKPNVCVIVYKQARTGSTWLARTLQAHPCVATFVPGRHMDDMGLALAAANPKNPFGCADAGTNQRSFDTCLATVADSLVLGKGDVDFYGAPNYSVAELEVKEATRIASCTHSVRGFLVNPYKNWIGTESYPISWSSVLVNGIVPALRKQNACDSGIKFASLYRRNKLLVLTSLKKAEAILANPSLCMSNTNGKTHKWIGKTLVSFAYHQEVCDQDISKFAVELNVDGLVNQITEKAEEDDNSVKEVYAIAQGLRAPFAPFEYADMHALGGLTPEMREFFQLPKALELEQDSTYVAECVDAKLRRSLTNYDEVALSLTGTQHEWMLTKN